MAIIQIHHITYNPPWEVELGMLMHRCVSRLQITRATPEHYAMVTNLMHAVGYEWNRMRRELDAGGDFREVNKPITKEKLKNGKES